MGQQRYSSPCQSPHGGNSLSEERENIAPAHSYYSSYYPMTNYNNKSLEEYVGLDCEMVGVGPGGKRSVLARVSVVDGKGTCLLDTFVRVQEKVTDYRSWVSGVHPGDLTGAGALDYGTCRSKVLVLINGKVLVGHGLQNDLKALAISHPWHSIRDTALYEPFMRYDSHCGMMRSQKLRDLTWHRLGRVIQADGTSHDSCVDAKAALDLYLSVRGDWERSIELSKFRYITSQRQPRLVPPGPPPQPSPPLVPPFRYGISMPLHPALTPTRSQGHGCYVKGFS